MKIKNCPKPKEKPLQVRVLNCSGVSGMSLSQSEYAVITIGVTFRYDLKQAESLIRKNNITQKELIQAIRKRV